MTFFEILIHFFKLLLFTNSLYKITVLISTRIKSQLNLVSFNQLIPLKLIIVGCKQQNKFIIIDPTNIFIDIVLIPQDFC